MEAIGHNGQLELTETAVRIKRKGILGFLTQGLKGDKEILISQITSIQFKRAGLFVNGYIQFAFIGGQEAKGGAFQAASDENTVMFRQGQQAAFEDFKAEIERRINTSHNTVTKISSNLDEIEKLASLRDRKVITEEEFQAKKKQLLGL
jgi:hypothetical protein